MTLGTDEGYRVIGTSLLTARSSLNNALAPKLVSAAIGYRSARQTIE